MGVTPGTRFGPYEIVSRIGAGGMGEVYRAKDTRLDRNVAVKVLPSEFARNVQLRLRFEREARTISQLSHPNICTLYDVGDDYLVMELLEGETLADRIARGPLPLADVLRYGAEIAAALDRAHRAGIVHRDLKPANVMITRSGAKLLDFGLARTGVQRIDPHSATVQQKDHSLTAEGTILGTFQYMAPEQLEAEEADARTDIFALGAVLYEMATGRRAFEGRTRTSLIAAIVGSHPQPVSSVVPVAPAALDHVIQKCLEKERDERWQSAHDVAEQLRWVAAAPASSAVTKRGRSWMPLAVIATLVVALAAATAAYVRARNARPVPRVVFSIPPPAALRTSFPRLAPDGRSIAFSADAAVGRGGIFLRRLEEVEPKQLTTDPLDYVLGWSADSQSLAYLARGPKGFQVRKWDIRTGTSELLFNAERRVTAFDWAADGTIVFGAGFGDGLHVLEPGGTARAVTQLDVKRRESFHIAPRFLPDGKRFLYVTHTVAAEPNEIWVGSTDGKTPRTLLRADALVGVAQGHIFFCREGAIYAQPFDDRALQVSGTPRVVAARAYFLEPEAAVYASVADTGSLVYALPVQQKHEWGWYDWTGRLVEKVFEGEGFRAVTISADRKRVAAVKFDPAKGADDLWVVDLDRKLPTKLTGGLAFHTGPAWSPSGDRIYFTSDRDGPYDVYVLPEDGSAPATPVLKSSVDKEIADITPDGKALILVLESEQTGADLWLMPIAAPQTMRLLIGTEAEEFGATISPDGRWLAFRSDRSGRHEIYVRHMDGGRMTQISTEGSSGVAWSRDGRQLLIRASDNSRWAVPLTFSGNSVTPGPARRLFEAPAEQYRVLGEGDRGLFLDKVVGGTPGMPFHYDSAPLSGALP